MTIYIGLVISVLLLYWGLNVWARSDLPIIFREIAINTRKDRTDGSNYTAVQMLSILYKIGSVICWFFAIVLLIAAIKYGKQYDSILFGIK